MGGKASKTTTGWRRRYLVTKYDAERIVTVQLMRGRTRRKKPNAVTALVSDRPDGGWDWALVGLGYGLGAHYIGQHITAAAYGAEERDVMLGYLALLRIAGFSVHGELPSW